MKDQIDKEKYIFKSKSSYDYKQYKPNKHNENYNYKYNKSNEHISKSELGYNSHLYNNNNSYKNYKSHSRDRSRHKSNLKEEKKIDFFEIRQRLRHEQSDLTLREMNIKNISNSLGLYQKFNKRPIDKVYDGFQWVPIENINKIEVHKPSQSILISNIPLYIDIDINDFVEFIEFFMKTKNVILSEEEEVKDILKRGVFIKGVEFNFTTNSAIVVLINEKLARNMILIDGIILYGKTLRVSPYIESLNEENKFKGQFSLANSADLTAKSAAIALSAVNSLFKLENQVQTKQKAIESDSNTNNININPDNHKDNDIQNENRLKKYNENLNNNQLFLFTKNEYQIIPSEVIKIKKFYSEGSKITKISSNDYIKLKENIVNSFGSYGKIVNLKIISSLKLLKIGVHFGDVFIEYDNINSAISLYEKYKNNEDSYKITYIDKESLYNFVLVEKNKLYSVEERRNK